MTKLLVVGPAPFWALPEEQHATAKNLRVWQLIQPLLRDQHQVLLCATDSALGEKELLPGLRLTSVDPRRRGWKQRLRATCRDFGPDGVLAVMWHNGLVAACLPDDIPLWIDLFGYPLGEVQLASLKNNDPNPPLSAIAMNTELLRRADIFSACSRRQSHALIGELGMAARLTSRTVGFRFIYAIPPGMAPAPGSEKLRPGRDRATSRESQVRLLWIGSYNAWTDVDTLFEGICAAMRACPELLFVSTGGSVPSVDESSYSRFLGKIAKSDLQHRFRMLGWTTSAQLDIELSQADMGLVIDSVHYETKLGTRTRLVEMMWRGLPIITTLGCELSYTVKKMRAGVTCRPNDPAALAEAVVSVATDPVLRSSLAANARKLARTTLSPGNTTRALRAWAKRPYPAPDRREGPAWHRQIIAMLRARGRIFLWQNFGRLPW